MHFQLIIRDFSDLLNRNIQGIVLSLFCVKIILYKFITLAAGDIWCEFYVGCPIWNIWTERKIAESPL